MYESYYGFERPPFKLVADPGMLFASQSACEALARLDFCMKTGKGIVVMTGEVGTGKTTIVNRFLDEAGADLRTAYIFNPTLTGRQLLRTLAVELGVSSVPNSKVDVTRKIYEVLLQNRQSGRRTVVFVDEAQVLRQEALEELRLVSNLETWHDKLLHIVLVGQPEFLETLESFALRPLRQRVELFIRIDAMNAEETRRYVIHRLRLARPRRDVAFTDAAHVAVHDVSGGNPRDVNKVCDAALLVAYVEESPSVTAQHVAEALETIGARDVGLRIPARASRRRSRRWAVMGSLAAAAAVAITYDTARQVDTGHGALDAITRAAVPAAAAQGNPQPNAPTTILIHLGSFPDRQRAETLARSLVGQDAHPVYLQHRLIGTTIHHGVLLGGFNDVASAEAFVQEADSDAYAYAQAVRLTTNDLETWTAP